MKPVRINCRPGWHLSADGEKVYLTPLEGMMILALMGSRRVTKEMAAEILWPDPDDMPDTWHRQIWCILTRVRSKLRPFGWTTSNHYGFGWQLERYERRDSRTAHEAPGQTVEGTQRAA